MDRRQRLIEIFEDIQRFYSQNPQLSKAAQAAKAATKLYEENDPLGELAGKGSEGQIVVAKHKTFEAAMQLHAEHDLARAQNVAKYGIGGHCRPMIKIFFICHGNSD